MHRLNQYLRDHAEVGLLSWDSQIRAAAACGVAPAQVEAAALALGIMPARYQRNRTTLSAADQLTIFRSSVAVIGCGGLGGYVIEELARLGVGTLIVIDPDLFEEHNLNRQLLSSPAALGRPKVAEAVRRVGEINPAVTVYPHQLAFGQGNGAELLSGCAVAVDALDSISVRRELAETCATLSIPVVHGAIAGWYGHVTTIRPGCESLKGLYPVRGEGKGIEQQLGNPSFTPAVVASLQVAEVCKLLLGTGMPLHGRTLMIDLFSMEFEEIAS